jgi:hypothetical protein
MQKIPLTQGKVALVDDADFEWAMQWKWFAQKGRGKDGYPWYAVRNGKPQPQRVHMHREIAIRAGLPFSRYYDHEDGEGLNNQRENIRPCTQSQNLANSRKRTLATSRFKGVFWHRQHRKWYTQIKVAGKILFLGLFRNEEAAAAAYQTAAQKHFGEFAVQ